MTIFVFMPSSLDNLKAANELTAIPNIARPNIPSGDTFSGDIIL